MDGGVPLILRCAVVLNAKLDKLDSLASGSRHMRVVIEDTEAFVRSRASPKVKHGAFQYDVLKISDASRPG